MKRILLLAIFGLKIVLIPLTLEAAGFDYPLGKPDGKGYSNDTAYGGLGYLEKYKYSCGYVFHPADDQNDDNSHLDYGSDANDAGDPVYATADGEIAFADIPTTGWGNIVFIEHNGKFNLPEGGTVEKVWSQYAHLSSIANNPATGKKWKKSEGISKGTIIGYVGDLPHGSGKAYHLHFEIRKKYLSAAKFPCEWSKSKVRKYYTSPTEFIKLNRASPTADNYVNQKREWLHPSHTIGNRSWNQIASVCSPDTGVCSGSLGSVDLTGWIWASSSDVFEMFEAASGLPVGSLSDWDEHPYYTTPYASNVIKKMGGVTATHLEGFSRSKSLVSNEVRGHIPYVLDRLTDTYDSYDHFQWGGASLDEIVNGRMIYLFRPID